MAIERSILADPVTLSKISRLELRARLVVEGVIAGMHKSPYHGFNVEFAQHREYTPGDEIRYIDWKVFGRSDRHYIKQFEEETNLKAYLLLDASASMTYKSGVLSKLEYGAVVGVALASLMIQQRDAVGLVTFDSEPRRFLPARAATSQLRQIVEELENVTPSPLASPLLKGGIKGGGGAGLHDIAERVKRRSLMIVISDLFENIEQVLLGLQHFRHKRHEVIVFHVLDRDEMTFPFRELAMFRDLEGELQLLAAPPAIRRSYLKAFSDYVTELQRGCREMSIDYVQMPTDEPVDVALWNYLAMRMRR